MAHCLNCGERTEFPPVCQECLDSPHRDGCRCQECFDKLTSRIATLETQLAAANEAVELLADEAACSRRTFPNEVSSINMREARLSTDNNPLARAEVEKASKV